MLEQELKLFIPKETLPAVQAALADQCATVPLKAIYYDTPAHDLARRHAALRIRNENGQWVQTLKLAASDAFSSIEYNDPLSEPALNLTLYQGREHAETLIPLADSLGELYRTDIERRKHSLPHGQSKIEIALDQGRIYAGDQALPVREVELELQSSGKLTDVFSLGREWIQQYQLKLDFRSKALRGDFLSRAQERLEPAAEAEAGTAQRFVMPSMIECRLRELAQQGAGSGSHAAALFRPLQTLPPMALLQLCCSDIASLAELEDSADSLDMVSYRLYLLFNALICLHASLQHSACVIVAPDLLGSLLEIMQSTQSNAADSDPDKLAPEQLSAALNPIFADPARHAPILQKMKDALCSSALQCWFLQQTAALLPEV